jgi:hypothetical protein
VVIRNYTTGYRFELGLWSLMPTISVRAWWAGFLVEETGVPRENHIPFVNH